jgi:DNA-binding GntR family transcriptional regulator
MHSVGFAPDSVLARLRATGLLLLKKDEASSSLGVRIYKTFRELLLSGVLSTGDMLNTRPLATELGVSTMPVREAMSRLVADGGLEALANRAFRVPEINASQFRELFLMRLRLETLSAEHAAARATPEDLLNVSSAFDEMAAASSFTKYEYLAAHRKFHFAIYRAARMPFLLDAIETLWLRMGPVLNLAFELADVEEETSAHRQLVSALQTGDPGASAKAVEDDLKLAGERTIRFLTKND